MNTLTIRTLGFPWLAALALTCLAVLALGGQAVLPPGSVTFWNNETPASGTSAATSARPSVSAAHPAREGGALSAMGDPGGNPGTLSPAQLFSAVNTREHNALREQLHAIRELLNPPAGDPDTLAVSQARARLSALIAAQDQSAAETPSAVVLTALVSRIDTAMTAMRQAVTPAPATAADDDVLLKGSVALALAAALLALLSGPLALAPARPLRASLAQLAEGRNLPVWGIQRHDEWGMIARQAACLQESEPSQGPLALSGPTQQLRDTAEAMSRLLLDSGQELARMRGEAGEAVNNAVMLGARLADAVLDAEARLQAREQRGAARSPAGEAVAGAGAPYGSTVDPAALWSAASAHADRLEEAATRALAVATVLPAAAERIEHAIAGLDRMAETVAANSDGLADLAARAGAAAAMLPEAAHRIEQAASGLGGVASRTSSAASVLPQAAQLIAQASADLGRAAEAVANNAAGLNDAVIRHTDAASSLPDMAQRIELAVAGLDRSAAALEDATDHVRITSRTAASQASSNEATQRDLVEAAQRMSTLGEQLPALAFQIVEATEGLNRSVGTVEQAADRNVGISQTIHALVATAEVAQLSVSTAAQRIAAVGDQLPVVARQVATVTDALEHSAGVVAQAADRGDETSRAVASLTAVAEVAQTALSGAAQRMASFGEELPGIAFQIVDATNGLDRNAAAVAEAAGRAEQTLVSIATIAAGAEASQAALSATLPHVTAASAVLPILAERLEAAVAGLDGSTEVLVAAQGALSGTLPHVTQNIDRLPALAERMEAALDGLDGTSLVLRDAAAAALQAGNTAEACASEAAAQHAGINENLRQVFTQTNETLPALTARIEQSTEGLQRSAEVLDRTLAAHGERVDTVASKLENRAGMLDQMALRAIETAAEAARLQDVTDARQSDLADTVQQITELTSSMAATLPALSARIADTVSNLEDSAATLAMVGASAQSALPAAALRIDEALAGLDMTTQSLADTAQSAAASVAESVETQSALAQTVQCMATVGEALPSLAMRLEGTLGALDRSTDSIIAAANDVAEAGRLVAANAGGVPEDGERRPPSAPQARNGADAASMRRLQSVASALAMAGNGTRG